jgi:hypothetical protein
MFLRGVRMENRMIYPTHLFFFAAGMIACASSGTEPLPGERPVSLSMSSLTLLAGTSDEVHITVGSQPFGVTLTVTGLPDGVTATLTPQYLGANDVTSTLKLSANASSHAAEKTVTILATPMTPAAPQTSAQLVLRVSECPGYAIPDRCPPFPTGGSNRISGTVMERTTSGLRPVAGAWVWAWVQYANGSGYAASHVETDSQGVYSFPNLPNALIVMDARSASYDQPCATIVELKDTVATANLEVVSSKAPIVQTSPSPPAVTGVVYETTSSGRQPVAGAKVYFEFLFETVAAVTTTDENGRYSLCSLPTTNGWITPWKPGYITTSRPLTVSGIMELDLEVKRQ